MAIPYTKLEQAQALINSGRPTEALAVLRPFVPREPRNVQLASLMGLAALRAGLHDEAEFHARRALAMLPGEASLKSNLAMTLLQRPGALKSVQDEAMRLLRETLAAMPHHMDALCTLAMMLLDANLPGELLRLCDNAIAHSRAHGLPDPVDPQFTMFHSQVLCLAGRHAEAFAVLDAAIGRFPQHSGLRLAAAVPLHVMPGLSPGEIARRHKEYGDALCRQVARVRTHTPTPADVDRVLRIGVMSPDLRRHSVAFFTLPWFERMDRSRFEIYVYAIGHAHDDMSATLETHATRWHRLGLATDEEITKRILEDRVDILIELAGLTSEQRFTVLAQKPAPVMMTYCGYPDTVGIPTIDYRVVDSHTDPRQLPGDAPPGTPTFDERCVERLIRLDPCFLCYTPPAGAPGVAVPPAEHGGGGAVTFVSFNSWRKLNLRVIALWGRVLGAVPGSRMLIKCVDMRDDFSRGRVRAMLDAEPAMSDRYELLEPRTTIEEHLAGYARVDIALDTLPYHGTTTTCEAMFMGVPVITLEGDTHVSRVGISLLRNVGLDELIARSDDRFVEIAASLAGDAARRASLRATLRERVLDSPLCDAGAFTRRFSDALRRAWAAACSS
ncbi:MAG TPA: hypothetical protein VHN77_10390 [Phycisphaerales bacterium]|nr:hypothetical protein [Phycisphaerales bacterium]